MKQLSEAQYSDACDLMVRGESIRANTLRSAWVGAVLTTVLIAHGLFAGSALLFAVGVAAGLLLARLCTIGVSLAHEHDRLVAALAYEVFERAFGAEAAVRP